MDIKEVIAKQLEDLINEGNRIVVMAGSQGFSSPLIKTSVSAWVTKVGQIITSLSGEDSIYYKRYKEIVEQPSFYIIHSNHYDHLGIVLGIIKALSDDFNNGLMQNVKNLLRAEIFSDFLEMSGYLLKENYKDAAAVLIGAVLEDSLRKIAINNNISIEKENGQLKTIEPINQELGKAEIYNKLIQKQITSWADLRNKAAHGNFEEYDINQVKMMLLFVEKFVSDYLT